jgi:hypothetical protein
MRSLKLLLALAAGPVALGLLPTHASAQAIFQQQNPPGQIGQYAPPFSPYNNLNRPGGAANNYYGLVKPQMDASRAINQLQDVQPGVADVGGYGAGGAYAGGGQQQYYKDPANSLTTGHPVTFFNTAQYFPPQTGARGVNGNGGYGNRGFGVNSPYAPYGVGGFGSGGIGGGAALVNGNVYFPGVNTPNASIIIGPNGPAVINRIP